MKAKFIRMIVLFPIMGAIVIALIVGNAVAFANADSLTGILCPPVVDEEALNATRETGQALSAQIVREGAVLVKNDNVLPLSYTESPQVNVFGRTSTDWVNGGSGSGQVVPEDNDASTNIDLLRALDEYGIKYNESLTDMYTDFLSPVGDQGSIGTFYNVFYRLGEPSIDDAEFYTPALLSEAEAYSDTALVVISRRAGETEDPTRVQYKFNAPTDSSRHYLEISEEEEGLLRYVGETYEKVVVIINSTNTMELGFLDTIPGLDACLVVGGTGTRGAVGIPPLLYGEYSPSGRLADTYAYDMTTNINYNFSGFEGVGHYTNGSELYPTNEWSNAGVSTRSAPAYVDYVEGIYVGYKWYETADAEGLWNGVSNDWGSGYDGVVQYPFGYGMSYCDFDWAIQSVSPRAGSVITEDTEITIEVRVTNNGDMPAMDVVELYVTPPYTDGGIEKAHVNLVAIAKTGEIAAGGSQVVTLTAKARDFASYDCYDRNGNGEAVWELDAGEYVLSVRTDAHTVKTADFDGGAQNAPATISYETDDTIVMSVDPYSGAEVSNKFTGDDAADGASLDGSDSDANIPFISRSDFPVTLDKPADRAMTDNIKKLNLYTKADADAWDDVGTEDGAKTDVFGNEISASGGVNGPYTFTRGGETKTFSFGENNGLSIYENGAVTELGFALGADYDDPQWDDLLDQITVSEATSPVSSGSFANGAVESIGKPKLSDYDGPAQCRSFNAGNTRGTGFPNATVIAQTWNTAVAYDFGLNYAREMDALGVNGVYGFGCNMHRSPFAGRNYEYYSEDAYLSAIMLTNAVRALKNGGKYTYLKHFAVQEVETERDSLYTWLTEQSLREIYLKPFYMAIQEGGCVGLMSSYNRIGHVWTGGSEALLTGILRDEWGFNGAVVTDYADVDKYMNLDQALRAGGDLGLGVSLNSSFSVDYNGGSPRIKYQLREAVHHVTYMWLSAQYANSVYNENADVGQQITVASVRESWVWWIPALIDLDLFVLIACGFGTFFLLTAGNKKKKRETEIIRDVSDEKHVPDESGKTVTGGENDEND